MRKASIITNDGENDKYRSTIRVSNFYFPNILSSDSSVLPLYYIRSFFPTASDSDPFGPDTFLYTQFLMTAQHHLMDDLSSAIDGCCNSGARHLQHTSIALLKSSGTVPQVKVLGLDLSSQALGLGTVNAHLADVKVYYYESNLYAVVPDKTCGLG